MVFRQKCSSCYIVLTDQLSLSGCVLILEILDNMCNGIVRYLGCDVMDFEINLIIIAEPFFLDDQKVITKI